MLLDIEIAEIIRHKKSQYVRYIDTKQWSKFELVALPDAELSFYNPDGSIMTLGRKHLLFISIRAFAEYFGKFFDSAQTLHMIGNAEFEMVTSDEVKVIWSMEDQIIISHIAEIRGGGYYYETWVKTENGWFLKSLKLERTYMKYNLFARIGMLAQQIGLF
jgi:hypothetical protein